MSVAKASRYLGSNGYHASRNYTNLIADVTAWQALAGDVHVGGLWQADWARSSVDFYSPPNSFSPRTFIMPSLGLMQKTALSSIRFSTPPNKVPSGTWKFKLFRYNAGTYDMVYEQSLGTPVTGDNTVAISSATVFEVGDIPGIVVDKVIADNGLCAKNMDRTLPTRYVTGDITTTDVFTSTSTSELELELFALRPYVAITGDSIAEGHNNGGPASADSWHGVMHDTAVVPALPGGVATSEILYELKMLIDFEYLNYGMGSQTYAWVAATGAPHCFASKAHTVIILCGVNDVSAARTWEQVEANLNTIKTAFDASDSEQLLICEILPWTAGSAEQATTIRTWNTNLSAWCSGKAGITLVQCHDELKDPAAPDDMLAAYDFDGAHFTTAGVAKMASIIIRYL